MVRRVPLDENRTFVPTAGFLFGVLMPDHRDALPHVGPAQHPVFRNPSIVVRPESVQSPSAPTARGLIITTIPGALRRDELLPAVGAPICPYFQPVKKPIGDS